MVLKVENLSYSYGDRKVLDGINFEVKQGEIVGIVGRNGSGKTTLFNCIQGISRDYLGSIEVFGIESRLRDQSLLAKIGVQFQSNKFFSKIKVRELFHFISALYEKTINEEEINNLLKTVHMEEYEDSYITNLSGGQQQKISLAISMVHNPDLLFLDEPTLGLDTQTRKDLWDIIKKCQKQGKTIVLTTHYLNEIANICHRIILINNGNIIMDDAVKTIMDQFTFKRKVLFDYRLNGIDNVSDIIHELLTLTPKKIFQDDDGMVILTNQPSEVLKELSSLINTDENSLRGVVINDVTLEDVFVERTGGSIYE